MNNSTTDSPVELLQLTDLHLPSMPDERLWGMNTVATFRATLAAALQQYPAAELIVLTGDLVNAPASGAYELLRESLSTVSLPIYVLPGNHDDPILMADVLDADNIIQDRSASIRGWQLLLLDSNGSAECGGVLEPAELQHLDSCLQAQSQQHTLVCLHHHPIPVKSAWMDAMALQNPDNLFAVLDKHPQVKAVLCGHAHQQFQQRRNGVQLMATPSTCVQFVPGAAEFTQDNLGPGYRWLRLHPDGRLESQVHYLDPLAA